LCYLLNRLRPKGDDTYYIYSAYSGIAWLSRFGVTSLSQTNSF